MELPESVQAKLDRAQKHIDDLLSDIAAFDERQPYRIVQDHNAELTELERSAAPMDAILGRRSEATG